MSRLDVFKFVVNHPLNSTRKCRAILDFAQWQIRSRLSSGDIVYEWLNGAKFLVRNGETSLTGNIYCGLSEFTDMGYLLHVLRAEDVFVDVGANVGSYSILAGRVVGARTYALEPVPDTYKRLVANIRVNHSEGIVRCINNGVSAAPGFAKFTSNLDSMNHVLGNEEEDEHSSSVSVAVTTLDDILANEAPSLLKIDVEGYESPVVEGASRTLQKASIHSVIMEMNGSGARYDYKESRIVEKMLEYGFQTYTYDPFKRDLISLDGGTLAAGNTLFIRNMDFVVARLKSASMVSIFNQQF